IAGLSSNAWYSFRSQNSTSLPVPQVPRHYPNIRIAELAYNGTNLTAVENSLLQNSVDLVISGPANLAAINAVAPTTPQLLYTNVSSLYQGPLTSWLNYADAHGISREAAFYHVTTPTPFSGNSPSSQPVDWFWKVYEGGSSGLVELTTQANGTSAA